VNFALHGIAMTWDKKPRTRLDPGFRQNPLVFLFAKKGKRLAKGTPGVKTEFLKIII